MSVSMAGIPPITCSLLIHTYVGVYNTAAPNGLHHLSAFSKYGLIVWSYFMEYSLIDLGIN